jgi:3-hydroxyacyl-CoA dehydrogenase
MLDDKLRNVAVVGAAGKMGRGIALLLLQEIALQELLHTGKIGGGGWRLNLIDANEEGFPPLSHYLRTQLVKFAEKNINALRGGYSRNGTLVSNEEMIQAYVSGAMDLVGTGIDIQGAKNAHLIFEAVIEDVDLKTDLFRQLKKICSADTYYFTNTSSIPIKVLNERAGLKDKIIGFHFYNPPAIQRLLEIIPEENTDGQLVKCAEELAQRLKKRVIYSKDVAGFIGNGHFMREILFAEAMVQDLKKCHSEEEAVFIVEKVTHDYLLRPMGIFQLLDYVGLDICQHVLEIMRTYIKGEKFEEMLVGAYLKAGIKGGQFADGAQKDGIFQYHHHGLKSIFSLTTKNYQTLPSIDGFGTIPSGLSWKQLQKDKDKEQKIREYFKRLPHEESLGAKLAIQFLERSAAIEEKLVKDGVAKNIQDVNTVLKEGFYHLYAPCEVLELHHVP